MRRFLLLLVLLLASLPLVARVCAEEATPAPEATDTQASDTQASDTQASDTQASDTQASDTQAADAQAADNKVSRTFEAFTGSAWQVPTHLNIAQSGQPDIDIKAHYITRPFYEAVYYAWRFAKWRGDRGREIEFIHHKLYLKNTIPGVVDRFDITHGYNLLYYNKARKRNGIITHFGGGVVITHPENTIRGRELPTNETKGLFKNLSANAYHLSGITAQYAVGKQFSFSKRWFAALEGKITVAYATVPVVDGHATVPNIAFHGLVGVGYRY